MTKFEFEHRRFDTEEPIDLIARLGSEWGEAQVHKKVTDHYFISDNSQTAVYVRDGKIKAKGIERSVDDIVDQVTDERAWQISVSKKFFEQHLGVVLSGKPDVKNFDAMKNAVTANGAEYHEVAKEIRQYLQPGVEVEVTKATIDDKDYWTVCVGGQNADDIHKTVNKLGLEIVGVKAEYVELLRASNSSQPLVMLSEHDVKGKKTYWAEANGKREQINANRFNLMQSNVIEQMKYVHATV